MSVLPILFGKASNGAIKQWFITADGPDVVIYYGQVGGKVTEKRTTSRGKNIGRTNETTPEQQAVLEAESKWRKQIKKDYAESIEAIPESTLPNLATKLQDKAHTLDYGDDAGVDELVKLDGVRCSVFMRDGKIFFQSRGGESYPIIHGMAAELYETYFFVSDNEYNVVVDGEIYCHGMHLEDITSAVKKHNKDTPRLKFYVFDLIDKSKPEQIWSDRYDAYASVDTTDLKKVEIVLASEVLCEEDIYTRHDKYVADGYEGIVVRPHKGVNSFGNRTASFIKYKKRLDAEFRVVSMEEDKNCCAVPWCQVILANGEVDEFKAALTGTQERNRGIWKEYMSGGCFVPADRQWLKVEFEAYSKYGIPAKPKGVCFRNCDSVTGEPLE